MVKWISIYFINMEVVKIFIFIINIHCLVNENLRNLVGAELSLKNRNPAMAWLRPAHTIEYFILFSLMSPTSKKKKSACHLYKNNQFKIYFISFYKLEPRKI